MNTEEGLKITEKIYKHFFPKERFNPRERKLTAASLFFDIFVQDEDVKELSKNYNYLISCDPEFNISIPRLTKRLRGDFLDMLRSNPNEVMGCMGLALSVAISLRYPMLDHVLIVTPRLLTLKPHTPFAELKSSTVGQLVSVRGYVLKVTACKPLILQAHFICSACSLPTIQQFEDGIYDPPTQCLAKRGCRGKYFEMQRSNVVATDFQRIKLQEVNPLDEDTTRVPRTFEVEVRGGLVDRCIAGDVVDVVGVIKTYQSSHTFSKHTETALHSLYVHVNSISKIKNDDDIYSKNDNEDEMIVSGKRGRDEDETEGIGSHRITPNDPTISQDTLTEKDYKTIKTIASTSGVLGLLCASLCPTIFGHELVKCGLLLGLFGGSQRGEEHESDNKKGIHIRSDIHMLVVGDPGLGKSQMLRAAATVAPRAVYVCANTTTTAGLTVALNREGGGKGDMNIEAGALVLADKGVCCIDELDKMSSDPHSLLEAMEQQQISIAKSGVVTSLRSRCSVLAAANPVDGHYNLRKTVSENLKMASALLSRFDLVFILMDKPNADHDKKISEHIMRTHALAQGQNINASSSSLDSSTQNGVNSENEYLTLSQRLRREMKNYETRSLRPELFRKYITYAKKYVHPAMTPAAAKILQKLYLTMRSQSTLGDSIPVTTRHLESLIRLSQARARIELREEVTEQDAHDVAHLWHESLLDAFTNEVGVIDVGRRGGISLSKQVKALVGFLSKEAQIRGSNMFTKSEIQEAIGKLKVDPGKVHDVNSIIDVMRTECYLLLKGPKQYQLITG